MVEIGAPGGGYIFGTSNCVMAGTPAENAVAAFETARECGTY